jgi:uncharacterized protein (TIRG00374 family)
MKKYVRVILLLVLVLVCVFFAVRGINWHDFWGDFKKANYVWLVPAMLCVAVAMVFRAFRWQCLLSPAKIVGFADLFSAINICFMANNFLPARSGEFIRAVIIGRKHKVSISTVLATVVLERIFDAMCVVGLFLFLIFSFTLKDKLKNAGLLIAVFYISALVILVIMRIYSGQVQRFVHRLLSCFSSGFAHKICGFLDSFLQGLNVLKEWKQVLFIVMYTILVWSSILLTYYFLGCAFDIHMSLDGYILLLCFLVIAVMVPIPGYIASFHLAGKEALMIFGYSSSLALSYATVAHGSQYIFITILGLLCLRRENLSFGRLKKEEEVAEDTFEHKLNGGV